MARWESLICETVQLGGKIVFLEDDSPENMSEWLQALRESASIDIPFVKFQVSGLTQKIFATLPQDLVLFFSEQQKHLKVLNPVLQGQRVLISETGNPLDNDIWDFIWSPCKLVDWVHLLKQVRARWTQLDPTPELAEAHRAPCLFLDRDDVVVKNVPYNKDPQKVELIPGITDLIARAHKKGYWVSLVTNQSGLGRGWVSWLEYQNVHQRMLQMLAQQGCWIDECVWSAYIDEGAVPYGNLYAGLRKPRSGMFKLVDSKLKVDMSHSIMVGDSASDLIAAYEAGVGVKYLFQSEKIEKERHSLHQFQTQRPDFKYEIIHDFSAIKLRLG